MFGEHIYIPTCRAYSSVNVTARKTWIGWLRVEKKRKALSAPGILEDETRRGLQEIYCYIHPQAIVPVYHFNTENVSNI